MVASDVGQVEATVLAIDVGATYVKTAVVAPTGELLDAVRREDTPYPCTPARLVQVLTALMDDYGLARVAVGFPGEYVEGRVYEPGNLSRAGGIETDIDPAIHEAWCDFALEEALRDSSARDVRVVNDAALAALGCSTGEGREFVATLGTGFGIALVAQGRIERIRDVGNKPFLDGLSYDQQLGEPSRRRDEARWNVMLRRAVGELAAEFRADCVHLGGGNARRVDLGLFADLGLPVDVNTNDVSLSGAARLFRD